MISKIPNESTAKVAAQPVILSMEVDDEDSWESEYRVRIGKKVKYIVISPGTFARDTLSFPLESLAHLPYSEEWTVAHISRDENNRELKTSLSNRPLAGVKNQWNNHRVDYLELDKVKQITASAFEALTHSTISNDLPSSATVIAKLARFEWELPGIERETRAYQLLEGSGLGPRFLAHIHENGRVIGMLLEKLQGRPASSQDLGVCQLALSKLHELRLLHGDVNRYNFLVTKEGAKLLDFERLQENASPESMSQEIESLRDKFADRSGRGGGFVFCGIDEAEKEIPP